MGRNNVQSQANRQISWMKKVFGEQPAANRIANILSEQSTTMPPQSATGRQNSPPRSFAPNLPSFEDNSYSTFKTPSVIGKRQSEVKNAIPQMRSSKTMACRGLQGSEGCTPSLVTMTRRRWTGYEVRHFITRTHTLGPRLKSDPKQVYNWLWHLRVRGVLIQSW